jgi:hypothetical protein
MKALTENYDDEPFLRYLEGKLPQDKREVMLANLSESERKEWLDTENALLALNRLPRITAPASLAANVMEAVAPERLLSNLSESERKEWLDTENVLLALSWLPGITAPASLMTNVMAGIAPEKLHANLSAIERSEWLSTENTLLALSQLPRITAPASLVANVMAAIAPKIALVPKKQSLLSQLRSWLEQHPLLGWEVSGMALAASVLFIVLAPNVPLPFQPMQSANMPAQNPYIQAAATHTGAAQVAHARFSLYAPEAHTITLIGEFNGWGSTRELSLRPQGKGIWTVEVPLPPGRYQYAFLIDGKDMATDPRAAQHVNDDFGRKNAVLTVL